MQFYVNVIVLASIYGLLAIGYVVVYRASRIINFAHGDFMMLGGYLLYSTLSTVGLRGTEGSIVAITIALFISLLISLIIYRLLIHSMLGQPVFIIIMVTIGLSVLLRGLATFVWGAEPKNLLSGMEVGNPPISFGKMALSRFDLFFLIASAAALLGLGFFYKYLKVGVQSRAASENPLLAAQRGTNIYLLFALSWGIASILASLAGILYGANAHIEPEIGLLALKAMPVALVGGMYSLLGIIPGAIIVSVAENIVAQFYDPLISDVIPMMILLVVLIIRPWGIFGKEEEVERV